ncbi:hypothetical protein R1flu_009946 [Riccia fluitans]|uniref:Uncharacterized protein n=1 Tax=Riccia fluitans TaxID=41844 RepID=A0ABD1Z3M1_9MARC
MESNSHILLRSNFQDIRSVTDVKKDSTIPVQQIRRPFSPVKMLPPAPGDGKKNKKKKEASGAKTEPGLIPSLWQNLPEELGDSDSITPNARITEVLAADGTWFVVTNCGRGFPDHNWRSDDLALLVMYATVHVQTDSLLS